MRAEKRVDLGRVGRVRLHQRGVGAEFPEVAHEGVHEAVVVVDHEHPGHSTSTSPGAMSGLTHGNTYQNNA